jgi:spermidine/putrescine-binding protein
MTMQRNPNLNPFRQWLAVIAVLALAGCSAGGEDSAETAEGPAETAEEEAEPASEAVGVACEVGEVDGDLSLFNWSDYLPPGLIAAFEDEYGVAVIEDFYPSNEEMLAKVQAGGATYDVVVPSDYMVSIMIEEELLLEIDHELVPNHVNLYAEFLDPPYDEGSRYSMPFQWGTSGLGVNLDVVGTDVEPSWALVFDPEVAGEFGRRISLLDDARETMAAALLYLGYSPNTTDEGELGEAADIISEARQHVAAFDSVLFPDLLLSGETVIGHGWNGTFLGSFEDDESYAYLIPSEGAMLWVDTLAILADTEVPCTAHTFVNFILDAEVGADVTNFTYYASPNEAAEAFLVPEILDDPAIYPDDETMELLEFFRDTGDAEILYTDFFTQAKS